MDLRDSFRVMEIDDDVNFDVAAAQYPDVHLWIWVGLHRYREASVREFDEYLNSQRARYGIPNWGLTDDART